MDGPKAWSHPFLVNPRLINTTFRVLVSPSGDEHEATSHALVCEV